MNYCQSYESVELIYKDRVSPRSVALYSVVGDMNILQTSLCSNNIIVLYMLVVQYLMQFSGLPRNISNLCSTPLCAGERCFN